MSRFANRMPAFRLALGAALGLALAAALVPGCTKRPTEPVWNNPFDSNGGGDPFGVKATVIPGQNQILVEWSGPNNPGIAHFQVLHSTDGTFYEVANKEPLGPQARSFPHSIDSPSPPAFNADNWYKVRALDAAGHESSVSRVVAAERFIGPYLEIAGGANKTPTRHVFVKVLTQVGDSLELADNRQFTGARSLPATPGALDSIAYDLGPASANNVPKHVWLRVKIGSGWSVSAHDSILTAFQPKPRLTPADTTVASRRVGLQWDQAGVLQTQFAAGADSAAVRAALPGAPVVNPDSLSGGNAYYTGTLLTAEPTRQWIYGRFVGDFGFAWVDTARARPDNLRSAGFTLAGGAQITAEDPVELTSHAVATQMRFGESVDLSGVPWRAYADTILFTLSPGPGLKTVYGEFANDWHTAAAVASITVVGGKRAAR